VGRFVVANMIFMTLKVEVDMVRNSDGWDGWMFLAECTANHGWMFMIGCSWLNVEL
jgi:hypothetical protein